MEIRAEKEEFQAEIEKKRAETEEIRAQIQKRQPEVDAEFKKFQDIRKKLRRNQKALSMVKVGKGDLGELLVLIEKERLEKEHLKKQLSERLMWKDDLVPTQVEAIFPMTYVMSFEPLGLSP